MIPITQRHQITTIHVRKEGMGHRMVWIAEVDYPEWAPQAGAGAYDEDRLTAVWELVEFLEKHAPPGVTLAPSIGIATAG